MADARWHDPDYLRAEQYRDGRNLGARANLHAKYGRGDWFAWLASQFSWPAEADVLEAGCGAGALWDEARALLPAGLRLTLTDYSPGMLAEALTRVRALGHYARVTGETADVCALPFADTSFDIVVANHMLYHAADPAKGVAELRRVLKPGGVALIATNGRDNMRALFALRTALFPAAEPFDAISARFSLETAEPILHAHFADVVLHKYPDTLRCTDADDLLGYVTSSPPGSDAPAGALPALRTQIEALLAQSGGVLTVEKSVGLFICRT